MGVSVFHVMLGDVKQTMDACLALAASNVTSQNSLQPVSHDELQLQMLQLCLLALCMLQVLL